MIFFRALLGLIITGAAFYGLFLGGCMKDPKHWHNLIAYYTNMSNIVVLIFQTSVLISSLFPDSAFYAFTQNGILQFCVMNMILVTFLVYHYILFPAIQIKKEALTDAEKEAGKLTPNNICVHYIVPLGSVLYWLLFANKDIPFLSTVLWLIIPTVYFIYILIRAMLKINIYGKDTPYPYFFIDRNLIGTKNFVKSVIACFGVFFGIGCVTFVVSLILR
ncbi:MAG: Pr6Pr family membrane protein [Oscillospiraceae bacterium]